MKILVLGATGMAGHTISLFLQEQGHDVTAFTTTPYPYCRSIVGDATDSESFRKILKTDVFDAVINCIGILNNAAEENKALAVYLNSYLPHQIVDTLKDTKTKYIHMSTDCVFSGDLGSYKENSQRDGESFYDRTKALGEVEDNRNLTFRNSIIGPDMNESGIGLYNWFMKQSGEINGYTQALWTGVTTLTLAKAMEQAIKENLCGLYNLVNNEAISKYNLCQLFNRYFKNSSVIIHESDKVKLNKSLVNTRTDFSFKVPSYEQMIVEMKEWVDCHKDLYPHYFR